jgi:hypothetical protein
MTFLWSSYAFGRKKPRKASSYGRLPEARFAPYSLPSELHCNRFERTDSENLSGYEGIWTHTKARAKRDQRGLGGHPPEKLDLLPIARPASSIATRSRSDSNQTSYDGIWRHTKSRAKRDPGGLGGHPPGKLDLLPIARPASSVATGSREPTQKTSAVTRGYGHIRRPERSETRGVWGVTPQESSICSL